MRSNSVCKMDRSATSRLLIQLVKGSSVDKERSIRLCICQGAPWLLYSVTMWYLLFKALISAPSRRSRAERSICSASTMQYTLMSLLTLPAQDKVERCSLWWTNFALSPQTKLWFSMNSKEVVVHINSRRIRASVKKDTRLEVVYQRRSCGMMKLYTWHQRRPMWSWVKKTAVSSRP